MDDAEDIALGVVIGIFFIAILLVKIGGLQ